MWVQTFSSETDDIKKVVQDANKVLNTSLAWADNKKVIGVVNRRPKNLGDLILKRKKLALNSSSSIPGTVRCTPLPQPGQKKKVGRPCVSCDLMSLNDTITSSANGKIFKCPQGSCISRNVIYCASCI